MSSLPITQLDDTEAKRFFKKSNHYVNIGLPYYFDFSQLLTFVSVSITNKNLTDLCKTKNGKPDSPKYYEQVNHTILSNKDGAYSWRPLQIIHPVLYVQLVDHITEKNSWKYLQKRFTDFSKTYVKCISIPRESRDIQSDKASLITHWWERIEQQSIKKSLEYTHVFTADISDCYGSIYTHSFEWALHPGGRHDVKRRIRNRTSNRTLGGKLGEIIDGSIRGMNSNQTNGIPQGSTLMDFLAEIILGYADEELTRLIKNEKIKKEKFSIVRYRDDYRIFVNDPNVGHRILKILNEVLSELNLKMNPAKTDISDDVILSSIKQEKLERFYIAPTPQKFQREALRVYQMSKKYPNSGLIARELNDFYDSLERIKKIKHKVDFEVLIAIISMTALYSPRLIDWSSTIISILLEQIDDSEKKEKIVRKIHDRFKSIPNTGLVEVWLQRISSVLEIDIRYPEGLTEVALEKRKNSELWNCEWLNENIKRRMDMADVSSLSTELEDKKISPVIQKFEVELFKADYF